MRAGRYSSNVPTPAAEQQQRQRANSARSRPVRSRAGRWCLRRRRPDRRRGPSRAAAPPARGEPAEHDTHGRVHWRRRGERARRQRLPLAQVQPAGQQQHGPHQCADLGALRAWCLASRDEDEDVDVGVCDEMRAAQHWCGACAWFLWGRVVVGCGVGSRVRRGRRRAEGRGMRAKGRRERRGDSRCGRCVCVIFVAERVELQQ